MLSLPAAIIAPRECAPAACSQLCCPASETHEPEFRPLHVKWIVISDETGNRRLQMHWATEE
jgi:hypothetical protein